MKSESELARGSIRDRKKTTCKGQDMKGSMAPMGNKSNVEWE